MKEYRREEILDYARLKVASAQNQSILLPVMGVMIVAGLIVLIKMMNEKTDILQTTLIADEKFLTGVGFAFIFMLLAAVGGFGIAQALQAGKGVEHQALKRLIELEEKETGQPAGPGDRSTRT